MPRCWSQDAVGPLARTAEDCALLLQPIVGYDPEDGLSIAVTVPDYAASLAGPIAGTTIGVAEGYFAQPSNDLLAGLLANALTELEQLGCKIRGVPTSIFEAVLSAAETVQLCEGAALHARWLRTRPADYSDAVRQRLEDGLLVSAVSYIEALSLRGSLLKRVLSETFGSVDVLLTPTVSCTAPRYDSLEALAPPAADEMIRQLTHNTRPISFLGLPAISVPCGRDGEGLPFAFQLVARPFDEPRLLALAHHYQRVTDHHQVAPVLD
jgi:aspartyl-tRNA(Asn)/glutamyl-tRNA(Gln) amidotransferase subunit A